MDIVLVILALCYLCGAVFAILWIVTSLPECWEACKQIAAKDRVPPILVLPLLIAFAITLWPLLLYGISKVNKGENA